MTVDKEGCLAAYAPQMCSDEQGASLHAACGRLLKGGRAASVDRGEGGGDAEAVFGALPDACMRALVCGNVEGRVLVVGMPGGGRDVSEVEVKWLSSLSTMPCP